jgi:23S rRNA pseudouridine1911/1915/1917 synthase
MPSKHMLPKGKRRQSVRAEYRAARGAEPTTEPEAEPEASPIAEPVSSAEGTRTFVTTPAAAGMRLDAFLAQAIPDISRARAQLLINAGQVQVDRAVAKASHKLRAGETVAVKGEPRPEPLHATPEDIPLDILYEDKYLAIINKPAGMMVHAGAGASDDARSHGTLVNALLHHMGKLSQAGGELRPGIVHRLDKETSGAILIAKDDVTHRKLSEMFSARSVTKTYVALVHGALAKDNLTVDLPIARDLVRRTRMTTRRADGRNAISHVQVLERLTTPYGPFTLVQIRIETGRTHQIRVHMQALGHSVVGDTLYGAPRMLRRDNSIVRLKESAAAEPESTPAELHRNFLHAAHLEFEHPRTNKLVSLDAPLPQELQGFLTWLRSEAKPSEVAVGRAQPLSRIVERQGR